MQNKEKSFTADKEKESKKPGEYRTAPGNKEVQPERKDRKDSQCNEPKFDSNRKGSSCSH